MRQDERHWTANLEAVKKQAAQLQDQIKAMVEKQKAEIQALLAQSVNQVHGR